MQETGKRAGVRLAVVVSVIGIDKLTTGHPAAKLQHGKAWLAGTPSSPARHLPNGSKGLET
jgi:hypothetical protein